MKKFFEIFEKDIKNENFDKDEIFIFGVVVPFCFLALLLVVDTLENLICN